MDFIFGFRKLIIVVLTMGCATALIIFGAIDQEIFKWLMQVSVVGYLAANTASKFSDGDIE